jgi:hypothetical protein
MALEGIVSKRTDAPYTPGNRGLWVKVKCLHREEFVVVGWTDPEGSRPFLSALLLAYYDPDGRLIYAGRAGTGITRMELERLWCRLKPLAISEMPLAVPPPRDSRFGSPLVLSRAHWVRPEPVAEVKYLTWTGDNLLRQVVYESLREDKPATEVRREAPHPKPVAATTLAVKLVEAAPPLKCSTVAVRQNDRRSGRSAWRDRPARGACPATLCSAPVRAACRPSPGNGRRRRAPPVPRSRPRPSRERTGREPAQ